MQSEIINANGAATALAHGGFNNATEKTWQRAAKRSEKQLDYFANFAKDVASGKSQGARMLQRAGMYADSARAAYENEHALVEAEGTGATEAARILGEADNCPDCIAWSEEEMGWIPLEEMLENYPIGASVCHSRCHCVIVTR